MPDLDAKPLPPAPAPTAAKIERFDLDRQKRPHCEGYYAVAPSGELLLVPPPAELLAGYRLATQAEVDAGKPRPAAIHEIAVPGHKLDLALGRHVPE